MIGATALRALVLTAAFFAALSPATCLGENSNHLPAKATKELPPELLSLLQKGRESLRQGNMLVARQFYQRAAEKGLAEAAFALAATYDARELSRMKGIADVPADAALARKWYEKAKAAADRGRPIQ